MFSPVEFSMSSETGLQPITIYGWTVQPGYAALFPWLSGLASRFEKYLVHSLEIEYVPRCGTSAVGTVIMAIDQDPNDALPPETNEGRQILMAHIGAMAAPVWCPVSMKYPYPFGQERYLRTTLETTTVEPRTADLGVLFVGLFDVSTSPGTTAYGDLCVKYDVELFLPQLLVEPATLPGIVARTVADTTQSIPADSPFSPTGTGIEKTIISGPGSEMFRWVKGALPALPFPGMNPARYVLQYLGSRPATLDLMISLLGKPGTPITPETFIGVFQPFVAEYSGTYDPVGQTRLSYVILEQSHFLILLSETMRR